jgi:hypothetical protein
MGGSTLLTRTTIAFVSLVSSLAVGCGSGTETDDEPLFADDFAATYREVRSCRRSGDHDLNHVRIVVNATGHDTFVDRGGPFPVGTSVVKVEYADPDCMDLIGFTAMRRDAPGSHPESGDWTWQRLDADRKVVQSGNIPECVSCHASCGVPPDGHDWTCAAP